MNLSRQVRNKQALIIVLNGTPSFDPQVSDLGFSPVRWDMGDGTLLPDANTFTHVYGDTSIYTVVSYKRLMNQYRSMQIFSDDLISVDMHSLTGMGGATSGVILLSSNPNLTAIIWPINQNSSTGNLTQVKAENCNLMGAIEIAGLTRITGSLWFYNNDNMTSFTLSAVQTMGSLTSVQFQSCNTLSTIDLTGAVNMRSLFNCSACSNLTSITFPNNVGVSTGLVTSMQMYQCPNLTSIDLSNYENTGGNFSVRQSTSLTTIIFPPAGALSPITEFRAEQADLTGLLDLSNFVTASGNIGIRIQQNSSLTSFLPPSTTGGNKVTLFWAYLCDLTGILDMSQTEILGGSLLFYGNSNLTGITFFAIPHSTNITTFLCYDCDLTGVLNVSNFQSLQGNFNVHNNPNLTSITNPTSAGVFTDYYAHDCNLTGTLDVSNLSGGFDDFRVYGNSNLTGITVPTSATGATFFFAYDCNLTGTLNLTGLTGGFRQINLHNNPLLTAVTIDPLTVMAGSDGQVYQFQECDITGTIDLSTLNKMGGLFWAFSNANLRVINFPTSTVLLNDVRLENCDLTGVLDWSTMNLSSDVQGGGNSNLTGIINPTNSNSFVLYSFSNCGITFVDMTPLSGLFDSVNCVTSFNACAFSVANVNQILVDFDTNSSGAISGRSLNLAGAGMGVPDATAGGNDGIAAKASLIVKGYSVTTN